MISVENQNEGSLNLVFCSEGGPFRCLSVRNPPEREPHDISP